MSINPFSANNYGWNYSKPDKDGYSTQLVGTVLAIQEVQKMGFTMNGQPGAPQFWPDGNPMMNIRLALATQDGSLKTFVFQPAGRDARAGKKRSVHMDLFHLTGDTDMMNLIGKTICIQTQEGHYGQGNPRPWFVSLVEDMGPFSLAVPLPAEFKAPQVLANAAASGGQVSAPQYHQPQPQYQQQYQQPQQAYQPAPQPQYQPQPMQQAYQPQPQPQYQQPMQQPQYQPASQPAYQQPMQPQPQQQAVMDPNIMAAMASQAFGGPVTVSAVQQPQADPVGGGEVYDEEMPF